MEKIVLVTTTPASKVTVSISIEKDPSGRFLVGLDVKPWGT